MTYMRISGTDVRGETLSESHAMRENINAALKEAVTAQNKRRIATLRLINAAIQDREIAARACGNAGLCDGEVLDILAKMIRQREEAVRAYEEAGRVELAEQERDEIAVIAGFMPRQLSDGEIAQVCSQAVAQLGCQGLKDIGRTMGHLKEEFAGQMDFNKASQIVRTLLK